MMSNGVELPHADLAKYDVPISPKRHSPDFTPEQIESFDFVQRNHAIWIKYLSGRWLDSIMTIYMDNFFAAVQETLPLDKGQDWNSICLHDTLSKMVYTSSAITFFGKRLDTVCPNMWDHWRIFNDALYIGVRSNISFYLRPRALLARTRMLRAFDRWVATDVEDWKEEDGVWNEKWGVRLNWEREKMCREHNFTLRGRACSHASFLWV